MNTAVASIAGLVIFAGLVMGLNAFADRRQDDEGKEASDLGSYVSRLPPRPNSAARASSGPQAQPPPTVQAPRDPVQRKRRKGKGRYRPKHLRPFFLVRWIRRLLPFS